MTHREMVDKLADAKSTIYKEIPLGSVWMQRPQIADVLKVNPSYTRFCITIYECKVSRSDFLSDIRTGKWKGYLDHCHAFAFVTKKGVTDLQEIPDNAGLIFYADRGFYTRKAPPIINADVPIETMMAIMFYRNKNLKNMEYRHLLAHGWIEEKRKLKKMGGRVAESIQFHQVHKTKQGRG